MTDSDPVIAEIDPYNAPAYSHCMPVHLSDAPLVEDLLEAAKNAVIEDVNEWLPTMSTLDGVAALGEWGSDDLPGLGVARKTLAAIRAIEPKWTP